MSSQSPKRKASASSGKKRSYTFRKHATEFEHIGLTHKYVEHAQVTALKFELERERELNKQLKRENDLLRADKDVSQKEVLNMSDYIVSVQQKVYDANQQSLELLESLKATEEEVEILKQYIIDLKSRIAVYIPVKGDATDKKLAEYINNYPDRQKLKIMFMRESEGVYEFGSKRIAVKVERDKIMIKVGGGYLSVDEFLD